MQYRYIIWRFANKSTMYGCHFSKATPRRRGADYNNEELSYSLLPAMKAIKGMSNIPPDPYDLTVPQVSFSRGG